MVSRVGPVNYKIDMIGRRRRRRVFHVNMLRAWHAPATTDYLLEEVMSTEDKIKIVLWKDDADNTESPIINSGLHASHKQELEGVLAEFADTLKNTPGRTTMAEHRVDRGQAHPIRLPPYRLPHAYRDNVKEELREMEASGVIEPSMNKWVAPVVFVPRKDGSLRFCVDYRCLNAVSRTDAYPMPWVDDLIDWLGNATYISTLDLTRGYWQVPVEKESQPLTAFVYQFHMMPFGLSGAPATFQHLMDRVLRSLDSFFGSLPE